MPLTKVTYSMIEDAPLNVQDFGATGNGSTNDTAAIQATLDAAAGKIVYFPKGEYVLTGSTYINHSMKLVFEPGAIITVTAPYSFVIAFEIAYYGAVDNVTIDGATFDFDDIATTQYGIGVRILDLATNITVRNCVFKNFAQSSNVGNGGDGIYIRLLNSTAPQDITVEGCIFENIGRNGISVTNYINGLNITNCTFNDCKMFGIDLEPDTGANNQQRNIYINECSFYECGDNSNSYYVNATGGIQAVTGGTFLIFNNLNINNCDFYFDTVVNTVYGIMPINVNMFTNCIISGCTITNDTPNQLTSFLEQTPNASNLGIVENCYFKNCELRVFLGNDCTLVQNRFEGDKAYLYLGNENAINTKVTDNTFYNCGSVSSTYVIYCSSTFTLIDSNSFRDYRGSGAQPTNVISLVRSTGSGFNSISNNSVAGTWSGFFVMARDSIGLTHNDRNKVSSNKVQGCGLVDTYAVVGWVVDGNVSDAYATGTTIIFDDASSCSITNNNVLNGSSNIPAIRVNNGAGGLYVAGNSVVSTQTGTNRPTFAISATGATSTASYFLGNFSQNTQSGFNIAGTEGTSTNNLAL